MKEGGVSHHGRQTILPAAHLSALMWISRSLHADAAPAFFAASVHFRRSAPEDLLARPHHSLLSQIALQVLIHTQTFDGGIRGLLWDQATAIRVGGWQGEQASTKDWSYPPATSLVASDFLIPW